VEAVLIAKAIHQNGAGSPEPVGEKLHFLELRSRWRTGHKLLLLLRGSRILLGGGQHHRLGAAGCPRSHLLLLAAGPTGRLVLIPTGSPRDVLLAPTRQLANTRKLH